MKQNLLFPSWPCLSFCRGTSLYFHPDCQLCSLSITISLTSSLHLSVKHLFPLLCNYAFFGLCMGPFFSTLQSPQSSGNWPTCFEAYYYHSQTPTTCITSLCSNYVAGTVSPEAWFSPLTDKGKINFMHASGGLQAFDLHCKETVSFFYQSFCHCLSIWHFICSLQHSPTHFETSHSLISMVYLSSFFQHFMAKHCHTTSPTEWTNMCFLTREGDVEPLKRYGEVRNEAKLGLEVAVQAGVNRRRPLRASESSQGLSKAAIFCYQEVVVMVLQVEGVKRELDTLKKE